MESVSTPPSDALEESFDIVARQDQAEEAIAVLRSDVDEVKARLDKVARAASRPVIASSEETAQTEEVKSFVNSYLRRGHENEIKSISGATLADGGYAIPRTIDANISSTLVAMSPIRSIAQVVQTGTSGYRKLIATGRTASGWIRNTVAPAETDTPKFAEIAPPTGELYANPAASQAMLDDVAFDLESWLAGEIANEFARAEGAAFINGAGTNQPAGFLRATTSVKRDATRAFGSIQYIGSGNASGFDNAPEEKLVDLIHAMKAGHRQGAHFVMNSKTLAAVRKLKTTDGAFLWQPGLLEGQPDRLLGYPVIEAEHMPDIAAGKFPIAFGNFYHGYLIAEHNTTHLLRDPYSNKPFVHFYATKRVGGQVLDSNAIKLLKIEA